jgi:hypothetical protein
MSLFVVPIVNADQISLKNGDRLTGIIVSMEGKQLVLKTIDAGDISIDWNSIEHLAADQALVVTTTDKKAVTRHGEEQRR